MPNIRTPSGRTRDPESKKRRLLDAALAEFSANGLAGSKIERIAHQACVSPGLVYTFWDSKEALFDAVLAEIATQATATVPLDAANLPDYAVRLHDASTARPDVGRYLAWHRLERPTRYIPTVEATLAGKIEAIAQAQALGVVSTRLTPAQTLAAVLAVAAMWNDSTDYHPLVPEEQRRQTVSDIVARITAP